jgi:hypothetical protein
MPLAKFCSRTMPTQCAELRRCGEHSLAIEIPCPTSANRSILYVSSNHTYTLTDFVSDLLFIDLIATQMLSTTVFENVSVRVVGGNVLPRLRVDGSHWLPPLIQNVGLMIVGAHVAYNVTMMAGNEPALTMLSISNDTTTVSGISLSFANASLRLVVGTSNGASARVAPLMLLAVGERRRKRDA